MSRRKGGGGGGSCCAREAQMKLAFGSSGPRRWSLSFFRLFSLGFFLPAGPHLVAFPLGGPIRVVSQLSEGEDTPSCHPRRGFLRQWVRGERDSDLDTLSGSEAACF